MNFHHVPWGPILLGAVKLLKVFGFLPGALAAFGVRRLYQKWRQNKAISGWPATEATILSGQLHQEGLGRIWVELAYSYYAAEYRSGTYIRRFRKEEEADEFIRQARDKRIQVHYDNSNPDRSVILDRDLELAVLLVPQLC
jgi:Protein of unknown function (DUF3592)